MDLYAFKKKSSEVDEVEEEATKRQPKKKRNQPVHLSLLHTITNQTSQSDKKNGPEQVSQASQPYTTTASRTSIPTIVRLPAHLSSTSLSLILHYLPLSSYLACSRVAHSWYSTISTARLSWSGTAAVVSIIGSREERRRQLLPGEVEERVRSFNPFNHHTPTIQHKELPKKSSPVPRAVTHPLEHASQCPLFRNVRNLVYTFADPGVTLSLGSGWHGALHDYYSLNTDVVQSEFPFASLPSDSFPFISSLALRNITLCSQMSIQSAFHRLGTQTHSFLRAVELQTNAVLSETEQSRTMAAVLVELGANCAHLEILSLPQRNLSSEIRLDCLLSLKRLHTLVFHPSFTKTPDRLQVIKSLSLHWSLRHLGWKGWTAAQLKELFGGISLSDVQEDETELDRINANEADDEQEEVIVGLDAEEEKTRIQTSASSHQNFFQFEEWTVDQDVSLLNMTRYFSCQPSILPKLRTLQFVQPANFSSFTPMLAPILSSFTNLEALLIHVPYYSLGDQFWLHLCGVVLPNLKRLRLDQLSLVVLDRQKEVGGNKFEFNPIDQDIRSFNLWRSFPDLIELTLANMTLPPFNGLSTTAPGLKDVRIENCTFAAYDESPHSTTVVELVHELSSLIHLTRLDFIYCPHINLDSLYSLKRCLFLERFNFFMTQPPTPSHTRLSSSELVVHHEWSSPTIRFFESNESQSSNGATPSASNITNTKLGFNRELEPLHSFHQHCHRYRRQQLNQLPPHERTRLTGMRLVYGDRNGTRHILPAERIQVEQARD